MVEAGWVCGKGRGATDRGVAVSSLTVSKLVGSNDAGEHRTVARALTDRGTLVHPLTLVGRFVLHTVTGVVLFAIVGGAAVALNYGADLIAGTSVSRYIVFAVQGLEFFLFSADFICLVVFVIKETWIFLREIVR